MADVGARHDDCAAQRREPARFSSAPATLSHPHAVLATLADTMGKVRGQVQGCLFDLPMAQGGVIDKGKVNVRTIETEELAQWWQMLLGSYYRVFTQVQDPASTGILSSGGSIFQQIYNFYAVDQGGRKVLRKSLALSDDQKK